MCYKTEEKANFVPDKPGTFQKGLLFLARSGHVHFNREKPIPRREGGALGVPPVTEVLDFDDLGRAIRQHGLRNHHSYLDLDYVYWRSHETKSLFPGAKQCTCPVKSRKSYSLYQWRKGEF